MPQDNNHDISETLLSTFSHFFLQSARVQISHVFVFKIFHWSFQM